MVSTHINHGAGTGQSKDVLRQGVEITVDICNSGDQQRILFDGSLQVGHLIQIICIVDDGAAVAILIDLLNGQAGSGQGSEDNVGHGGGAACHDQRNLFLGHGLIVHVDASGFFKNAQEVGFLRIFDNNGHIQGVVACQGVNVGVLYAGDGVVSAGGVRFGRIIRGTAADTQAANHYDGQQHSKDLFHIIFYSFSLLYFNARRR